jgi:hypothetical protein
MNWRALSTVLIVVNLALAAGAGYLVYRLKVRPSSPPAAAEAKVVTNTLTQIAVRKINATNLLAGLTGRTLNWAALESTNYPHYIANLRAIGCPEETIRDIIITDVCKLYAKRRAELRSQEPAYQFWKTSEGWNGGYGSSPALQQDLRALDKEQRALIKELLGVDYQAELAKYWEDDYPQRLYGFLPAEKRQQVMELQERFEELEQEIYARSKGFMLEEDQERLRQLQKQREEEMAKVLTPEEMEEYELRHSNTANNLRYQLAGFEPNEEEFRKIFPLQKAFDDTFSDLPPSRDDAGAEARERAQQEAQAALHEELRKALGETRFNEYVRAQDADYKTLVQMTDRLELPKDLAGRVYEMKREAERQRDQVQANPNLTAAQRQAALAAIAQETERSVAGVMGDSVFKVYQKNGAQWIRGLGVSPEPEPVIVEPEEEQP